jgi:hypothetical protein
MNAERTAVVLIALMVSGACGQAEDRYLKRQVRREEVVGMWRKTPAADNESAKLIAPFPDTIILSEDGTCRVRTLRQGDTACRWRIDHAKRQALFLVWETKPASEEYFHFDESDGRLVLWQYADDPDAWRYVEYQKAGV